MKFKIYKIKVMLIDDTEYKFEGSMDYDIQKRFDNNECLCIKYLNGALTYIPTVKIKMLFVEERI